MPDKPTPLEIPRSILEEVYQEARKSFPYECCGWLGGARGSLTASTVRPCVNAQALETHPTVTDRTAETAYVIAGQDLMALNHSLDSDMPARIIYHSHPNGRAYFSPTDQEVATSPWDKAPVYPVQQLVVGIDTDRVVEAALYAWSDEQSCFIEVARYDGTTI